MKNSRDFPTVWLQGRKYLLIPHENRPGFLCIHVGTYAENTDDS